MLALVEKLIEDFNDEKEFAQQEKCPSFKFVLHNALAFLTQIQEAFLDGLVCGQIFHPDLRNVLRQLENEIGFVLWTEVQEPEIHQRIAALLLRLSNYQRELSPFVHHHHQKKGSGTFHLPLYSRSDSFRGVDYDMEARRELQEKQMGYVKRIALQIQKESLKITAEYTRGPNGRLHKSRNGSTKKGLKKTSMPPPPPPPPPSSTNKGKFMKRRSAITRLPKVIRLFHTFQSSAVAMNSSCHRTSNIRSSTSSSSVASSNYSQADPAAVIGELMSKSKHAQRINEEVEKYGDTIRHWAEEIKKTTFNGMDEVYDFVLKMDRNINQHLTDETTIFKKFTNWPLRYDVMREASGRWKQLKEFEYALQNWKMEDHLPFEEHLKKMREFLERVDFKLQDLLRTQPNEELKYDKNGLPWPSELFDQVKRASLILLDIYMKQVLQHLKRKSLTIQRKKMILSNCAAFAFKVHQLVGGFNEACTEAFTEIEIVAQQVIAAANCLQVSPPRRDPTPAAHSLSERNFTMSQSPFSVANC